MRGKPLGNAALSLRFITNPIRNGVVERFRRVPEDVYPLLSGQALRVRNGLPADFQRFQGNALQASVLI
jgi:hypothetical protein